MAAEAIQVGAGAAAVAWARILVHEEAASIWAKTLAALVVVLRVRALPIPREKPPPQKLPLHLRMFRTLVQSLTNAPNPRLW
jgi:hypothetical protein